jgi:hypothetical protein
MKIKQFLEHHGISRNPFAEEDAQTDPVFQEHCIDSSYHPSWEKIYGDPSTPATSLVFGEKGSGKTAVRLQIARHLTEYNRPRTTQRNYVIHYDDFNPFLDRFRDRFGGRKRRADRVLAEWKLWDHMDAILSLGVTGLIDEILDTRSSRHISPGEIRSETVAKLDRHQSRDLLLLAACYDQSTQETFQGRWHRLRKRLKFRSWFAHWDLALGWFFLAAVAGITGTLWTKGHGETLFAWRYLCWLLALGPWVPWLWRVWSNFNSARKLLRFLRVGNRELNPLRQVLMHFRPAELASQPLPCKDSTDDRYELLLKFQSVLGTLGFDGVVVLVDRVDEPHLINGSAELMKSLVWSMLDNKFLKHPGIGLKLMLPIELRRFVQREDREFYQRARLDKQNMIPTFEWTGEALFDVANTRIEACAQSGSAPTLRDFLDPAISDQRLLESFRALRVPRNLFKFLYRVLVDHCNTHTDQAPEWIVSAQTYESALTLVLREQEAFDQGTGPG